MLSWKRLIGRTGKRAVADEATTEPSPVAPPGTGQPETVRPTRRYRGVAAFGSAGEARGWRSTFMSL
jgi:hypothetical protein